MAPYAVRPVPRAGVSVPITWDELDDPDLRPDRWDLKSAVARVESVGDLFAGALTLKQELPPLVGGAARAGAQARAPAGERAGSGAAIRAASEPSNRAVREAASGHQSK